MPAQMLITLPGEAHLAPAEAVRLADLEAVVERGVAAFVEVGQALLAIHDERLYRATHATFEDYCRERWGFSRSRGYRLIDGARVAELVSPMGDIPNERQARELVPLLERPDELVEVVLELRAKHGERVTAAKVRQAVEERLAFDGSVRGLKSSRSTEWYTPAVYVDAAREVLGTIDLDPASCEQANTLVAATRFYGAEDDGLAREWRGRVFLNPPYNRSGDFVTKLCDEHAARRVEAAVVLLNGYGFDAAWFAPLWRHLLCFTDHRIAFWSPLGQSGGPINGNVFVYLGAERRRFTRVFSRFGHVVSLDDPDGDAA
jgi:phage N-6-adenine-methyltransferase